MIWRINKLFKGILTIIIISIIIIIATTIYFTITYPLSYKKSINIYSEKYNVDPYLVAAIINVESNYDKDAISPKSARGLMQISSTTGYWAAEALKIEDFDLDLLFDPEINIMVGTWYLDVLSKEFDNNLQLILAAYNGGSGNVKKWLTNNEYCEDGAYLKKIPFKETEQYVEKVLKNVKVYKTLYKDELDKPAIHEENNFLAVVHNLRKVIKSLVVNK